MHRVFGAKMICCTMNSPGIIKMATEVWLILPTTFNAARSNQGLLAGLEYLTEDHLS